MKNYLILSLFLLAAVSCRTNDEDEQLKIFLAEWSKTFESKSMALSGFYDPLFLFPKDIFNSEFDAIKFSFDLDSLTINSHDQGDYFTVWVPFKISFPDSSEEAGSIFLSVQQTENGFIISEMSHELALEVFKYGKRKVAENNPEHTIQYDSIIGGVLSSAKALSQHYDSVVYYTEVDDVVLFYVVKGSWENPYPYDYSKSHTDKGNYTMGVVTAENKVIVPVEYSKIYNPNGSFDGMIEVENNGARGLFHITGGVFIPAEFDGIYPTRVSGAVAQVKKGAEYGWVDSNGKVSFDPASQAEKKLFQSPIESNAILEWEFKFPGPISLLINLYEDPSDANGIIVYPSYIRDFGITKVANPIMVVDGNQYGMGTTDLTVKFEKVETISDKFFGLIAFFMEAGADARDYHTIQNDLLVVDKNLSAISHIPSITDDSENQDPCGLASSACRSIEPGLYESQNGHGVYKYYSVSDDGDVDELKTDRQYSFTKFALIDERYFNRCEYESVYDLENGNMVLLNGVDLDVMRNEIFAEYGFIFKSPKWKAYFEAKPWYKPRYDNVDKLMTEKDKANIKFILEYQGLHKGVKIERDTISFGWAG